MGRAKLILAKRRLSGGKESSGVQRVVAKKFIKSAVELIGPAARDQIDYAARDAAVLSEVAVGLHFELAERINVGRNGIGASIIPVVVDAV